MAKTNVFFIHNDVFFLLKSATIRFMNDVLRMGIPKYVDRKCINENGGSSTPQLTLLLV